MVMAIAPSFNHYLYLYVCVSVKFVYTYINMCLGYHSPYSFTEAFKSLLKFMAHLHGQNDGFLLEASSSSS